MIQVSVIIRILLLAAGIGCLYTGYYTHSQYCPASISWEGQTYSITEKDDGSFMTYTLTDGGGREVLNLSGSTDLVCDHPYMLLMDVNTDGEKELYFHHCGGHGIAVFDKAKKRLQYKDLGQYDPDDLPALNSFWFSEIKRQGRYFTVSGVLLLAVGTLLAIRSWRVTHSDSPLS